MRPSEILETVAAVRDAQAETVLNLTTWLQTSREAALARLADARQREAELFKIILHVNRKPGFQPGHKRHQSKGGEAAI